MQNFNPKLDLVLERTVDLKPELIWKAWTTPELIKEWFCPRPWKVVDCKLDLKPGGIFATTMKSPEGESFPNNGCFLEVVENRKLVWTSSLHEGFRPAPSIVSGVDFPFTAKVILEATANGGTKYTAIGMHGNEADRKRHEEMGFQQGWGICLDQLIELMQNK